MAESQVVAVRVSPPGTAEHHITDFRLDTGIEMPKLSMIVYIQMNSKAFYTYADNQKAYLEVARTPDGVPYVRSESDSTINNNLLHLPRF
ncbi:DUF3892 domain-containing protein [Paenibacillus sp. FSL R5-0341]|uniref:DUF3892 domain-containing protein n=1 Tax=Paenibacillus sp. FSL R5-0341 TaxID=2921636 RepID=UPI0030D3B04D